MRFSFRLLPVAALLLLGSVDPARAQGSQQPAGKGPVYTYVEQMPEYPGGQAALVDFVTKNLKYPAEAKAQQLEGKVFVKFVVDEQGRTRDAQVVKGVDDRLDAEALRVVKAMPTWAPGKQNGRAVAVYFTMPIEYRL